MKTENKFYEKLSKFKKTRIDVNKYEFRDVKTLDNLVKEGQSLINGHKRLEGKYNEASDELRAFRMAEKSIEKQSDELVKVRDANKKKYEAAMANDQKAVVKMNEQLNKMIDKVDKAEKKFKFERTSIKEQEGMIKGHISEMNSAISAFETAAKSLGLDVSSKVNKYKSMVSKLKEREDYIA